MIQQNLPPQAQNGGDIIAGAVVAMSWLGSMNEYLTAIATILAIVWTGTRLWDYYCEKKNKKDE